MSEPPSVDPKVLELRKMMADRYKRARPEDKPQVRECQECGKEIYSSKICPASGRLHDRERMNIIGGRIVDSDKRVFTGKELVAAIDATRIKWQPARLSKVRVDGDAASIFQTFVLQRAWKLQRLGIMYGTYDASTKVVSVHCVYEPEQVGSETTVEPIPDPREERVDALAGYLGLQRVGIVMTHPPRDTDECILEGKELLLLAREQSRFGDHCVLLAISPSPETQEIQAQAWQASEQCVNLFQIGLLTESSEDTRYVASSHPLEIAQESTDEKGHKSCVIKEPAKSVDARWMTAYVAVEAFTSDIIGNRFVRISRPGEAPPTFANLRRFLDDPKRKTLSLVEQIRDFHVLIFLMENLFDWRVDMPQITKAVVSRDKNGLAASELVLREHMRQAGDGKF
jgi:nuclear protein localization family protein 4